MAQHYHINWLLEQLKNQQSLKFIFFWGHTKKPNEEVGNFCFSQWYELPFTVDGVTYKTAEHWMMAHKALLFEDNEVYAKIISSDKPGEAKKLGRTVKNFDEKIWNEKRFDIVVQGNIHKFEQHPVLKEYLINTGNRILVEASPVDRIWGIGLSKEDPQVQNPYNWRGLNLLGFALMESRDYLLQS